ARPPRWTAAATAAPPGPITPAVAVPPACRPVPITCASNERRASGCSTFGRAERLRVPSPAASTIARHVRAAIKDLTPSLEYDRERWKVAVHGVWRKREKAV